MDVRHFPTGILLQTLQIFGLVFQNGMLVMHNFTFILYFVSTGSLKRVFKSFIEFAKASTVDISVVFTTKNRIFDIFRLIKKLRLKILSLLFVTLGTSENVYLIVYY